MDLAMISDFSGHEQWVIYTNLAVTSELVTVAQTSRSGSD